MEIIVGRNPVLMALKLQRRRIHELLVVDGARDPRIREAIHLARQQGIPYRFCSHQELNRLAPGVRHQGIGLRASALPTHSLEALFPSAEHPDPVVLALDQVQDPQNLGAALRVADATGVEGVLLPTRHAADISPTVARTSAGSVEAVRIVHVNSLTNAIRTLQEQGFWVVGADTDAEADYWQMKAEGPLCLVLGSEGEGLRRTVRKACDHLVRIPILGHAESLNVSVAAGVLLYEVLRQRREHAA